MAKIVALISDLIFRSRIEGAARAAGRSVDMAVSARDLEAALAGERPEMVIVDMDLPADVAETALRAARTAGVASVVAFYAHAQTELGARAKECGADVVLPRSAFVARLPALLAGEPRA